MAEWLLQADMVVCKELRLRLHRIGLSHWRAEGVLRSWGAVPMHCSGDRLHVPCADDEALWLGAWLDDEIVKACVTLSDPAAGRAATIAPPAGFQIAGLCSPNAARLPIVRANGALMLAMRCGLTCATAALMLHTPAAWTVLAARPAPAALTGPPPLPPLLG